MNTANAYIVKKYTLKSFPSHLDPLGDADLRFHGHQLALRDARASHGVLVYSLAFSGTCIAYPRRDGQAELACIGTFVHFLNAVVALVASQWHGFLLSDGLFADHLQIYQQQITIICFSRNR